jgi:hypothetical protein
MEEPFDFFSKHKPLASITRHEDKKGKPTGKYVLHLFRPGLSGSTVLTRGQMTGLADIILHMTKED